VVRALADHAVEGSPHFVFAVAVAVAAVAVVLAVARPFGCHSAAQRRNLLLSSLFAVILSGAIHSPIVNGAVEESPHFAFALPLLLSVLTPLNENGAETFVSSARPTIGQLNLFIPSRPSPYHPSKGGRGL
jgi:hypothetical protein